MHSPRKSEQKKISGLKAPVRAAPRKVLKQEQKALRTPVLKSTKKKDIPMAYSSSTRSRPGGASGEYWRATGREYLSTLNVPQAGLPVGHVLAAAVINPAEFTGTRLATLAGLYELYSIRKLVIHYEPAVSTIMPGQIGGFFDRDSNDAFPATAELNLRQAASSLTFRAGSVWSKISWSMEGLKGLSDLYCDRKSVDSHWSNAGVFQVITSSQFPSQTAAWTIGTLYLDYDIEFATPQLESVVSGGSYLSGSTSLTYANPWGTSPDYVYNGVGAALPTGNTLYLPAGGYQMTDNLYFTADDHKSATVTIHNSDEQEVTPTYSEHTFDTGTHCMRTNYVFYSYTGPIEITWSITTDTSPLSSHLTFINPVPPPTENGLSRLLVPHSIGRTLLSRSWSDLFKSVDWKVPATLAKRGVEWLISRGWGGRLTPYMKGFSRLIGLLLSSGLLSQSAEETIPKELLAYWTTCGFNLYSPKESTTLGGSSSSTSSYVFVEEKESSMVRRR